MATDAYNELAVDAIYETCLINPTYIPDTVHDLTWHALPRLICEVREVSGRPPLFSTTSVERIRVVNGTYELMLTLEGRSQEISCTTYMEECKNQPEFKGFSLFVITPIEDRVKSLAVGEMILEHRTVLLHPDATSDFTLCILQMFLENCTAQEATSSMFVQVHTLLQRLEKTLSPLSRLRNLLFTGVTWTLNTLMYTMDHNPFDNNRILPHHIFAKLLLGGGKQPPSILTAIFTVGSSSGSKIIGSERRCPSGLVRTRPALLNVALQRYEIQAALYKWWLNPEKNIGPASMFIMYE
nr:tegument protein UL7 [Felid alphaherpesvirus 1]